MSSIPNFVEILVGSVVFLIDIEDFDRVKSHRWNLFDNKRGHVYAQTHVRLYRPDGASYQKTVRLHRFLLNAEGGVVDHINGITTDNRKANLRLVDWTVNSANRSRVHGGPQKTNGGWIVRHKRYGHPSYHGFFKSHEEAQKVFNATAPADFRR